MTLIGRAHAYKPLNEAQGDRLDFAQISDGSRGSRGRRGRAVFTVWISLGENGANKQKVKWLFLEIILTVGASYKNNCFPTSSSFSSP